MGLWTAREERNAYISAVRTPERRRRFERPRYRRMGNTKMVLSKNVRETLCGLR